MASVITNVALVLDGWQTAITAAHIGGNSLFVVYDESLEYSESVRHFRSKNNRLGHTGNSANRLLAYNREVLRPSEHGMGRRRETAVEQVDSPTYGANLYKAAFGELPIRFVFSTPDAREMEAFEVGYMAGEGIRTVKDVETTFPGLDGPLTYHVHWDELESKEIEIRQSYHKAVTGGCRIEGWWLVLRTEDSPSQLISAINTLIQNEQLIVFDQDTIVPDAS